MLLCLAGGIYVGLLLPNEKEVVNKNDNSVNDNLENIDNNNQGEDAEATNKNL